ncbi:MAG: hypothetical protein GY714_27870 [Desulfobacterales bacterium]|nr:hypothetical protein [Desulfobacterales bacterium]MCP4160344.1 hypothetical protein [Deltaproteobacteria bacterium]
MIIKLILLIAICFFTTTTVSAEIIHCKNINKQRAVFLKMYKQKKYEKAYTGLRNFMEKAITSKQCRSEIKKIMIWAYSDLALAAYKKNDPKACFECFEDVLELIDDDSDTGKPLSSLMYNYGKCMDLKKGISEAKKVYCNTRRHLTCMDFRELITEKIKTKKPFNIIKCKHKEHNGLDLRFVNIQNCLVVEQGKSGMSDEMRTCPKIYLINGAKKTELQLASKKTKDKIILLKQDKSDCCNNDNNSISVLKEDKKILIKFSNYARDCYGGTAAWFFEDIYELDLVNRRLLLINNKHVGIH